MPLIMRQQSRHGGASIDKPKQTAFTDFEQELAKSSALALKCLKDGQRFTPEMASLVELAQRLTGLSLEQLAKRIRVSPFVMKCYALGGAPKHRAVVFALARQARIAMDLAYILWVRITIPRELDHIRKFITTSVEYRRRSTGVSSNNPRIKPDGWPEGYWQAWDEFMDQHAPKESRNVPWLMLQKYMGEFCERMGVGERAASVMANPPRPKGVLPKREPKEFYGRKHIADTVKKGIQQKEERENARRNRFQEVD